MKFGLPDSALNQIQQLLHHYPEIEYAKVFGSRAMGNERPESDLDLALWGNIDDRLLAKIYSELDELPLPYQFDILVYTDTLDVPLREHIDQFAKELFSRKRS